jgi:2-keto-4-pentenoate hydratase/2-oxohepta-3-ene-1,7-dioic acid hydratase in catechol pathway
MKCICVGRNYAAHAAELKNELPTEPVIFLKPSTAVLPAGAPFVLPAFSQDMHYEGELIFRVGKRASKVSAADARSVLDGVGVGVDWTARDLQNQLKGKGLPWELSKAFDGSAVLSEFQPIERFPELADIRFTLSLNGEVKQQGHSQNMIFSVATVVEFVSRYFTLEPGDVIFTGTPEGVGRVKAGDRIEMSLAGTHLLTVSVQ